MREFITIVENADHIPQTLQAAAEWIVAVNDDILPEHFLEADWEQATAQQCCELIERIMLHGDCHPFATAVSDKTGWPMLHIMDEEGSSHYVCKTPDGKMIDFAGYVTLAQVKRRYRMAGQVFIREVTESGHMDEDSEAITLAILKLYFTAVHREPFSGMFR